MSFLKKIKINSKLIIKYICLRRRIAGTFYRLSYYYYLIIWLTLLERLLVWSVISLSKLLSAPSISISNVYKHIKCTFLYSIKI